MTAPPEPGQAAEEAPVKCVCGRLLTDPVSRGRGLGPRCYEKLRARSMPRPRVVGTYTAAVHPLSRPPRPGQLALDWDDQDEELDPYQPRITDVPTGAFL